MIILGGCVNYLAADVHRFYNYIVLIMIVITNAFNPIGFLPAFVVTATIFLTFCILTGGPLASTHEVGMSMSDTNVILRGSSWWMAGGEYLITFILEKLLPVIFTSLACKYQNEKRLRIVFLKYCDLKVQRDELVKDQKKMQELLANSLPKVVIRQVQDKGEKPIIDGFGTILFADIVSFTVFSGTVNAVELVQVREREREIAFDVFHILRIPESHMIRLCEGVAQRCNFQYNNEPKTRHLTPHTPFTPVIAHTRHSLPRLISYLSCRS